MHFNNTKRSPAEGPGSLCGPAGPGDAVVAPTVWPQHPAKNRKADDRVNNDPHDGDRHQCYRQRPSRIPSFNLIDISRLSVARLKVEIVSVRLIPNAKFAVENARLLRFF